MEALAMRGLFLFRHGRQGVPVGRFPMRGKSDRGAASGKNSTCFLNEQNRGNSMNAELKSLAITLAVLAVIFRVDGARRLLTNSF